jgi:opacity protein-like surface antigen
MQRGICHINLKEKMKNSKHALVALLAIVSVSAASAQSNDGYYAEAGYLKLKLTSDSSIAPTPKLLRLVIGKNIHDNLSVEGMVGLTASKSSWSDSASQTEGKVSATTYGVIAKPKFAITNGTEVFARVGIAHTSWKDEHTGSTSSDSVTKAVYGAGIQTEFSKNVYGQLDYMSYGGKDAWKSKGFTFSVGTSF